MLRISRLPAAAGEAGAAGAAAAAARRWRCAGARAHGHDDVIARHARRVGLELLEVEHDARAAVGFGREHGIDAVRGHVDAARGQRQRGARQVQEMRAGLSMVKLIGSGAGPLRCRVS